MIVKLIKNIFKKPSLADVLSKEFSLRTLNQISSEIKDRREIFEVAGKYYSGGANALAKRAASLMKLKFTTKVESEKTAVNLQASLLELKNLGACPVIRNSAVIALVCVDPELVKARYKLPDKFPLLLGTWSTIRNYWACQGSSKVVQKEQEAGCDLRKVLLALAQIALEKNEVSLIVKCQEPFHYQVGSLKGQISAQICRRISVDFAEDKIQVFELSGCGSWEARWSSESHSLQFSKKFISDKDIKSEVVDAQFNYKIMIVDDSNVFSQVLRRFLKDRNYKIEEYNRPELALRHLKSGDLPHLLISDLNMPKISGKDLVKAVREDNQLKKLPIVILTSETELEVRMELISKGADAFISKSDDPRLLAVQVQALLERFYGELKCISSPV